MKEVLERFKKRNVLVVGDICLDRTKIGDVVYGSSREADIPTIRYIHGKQGHSDLYSPGGGANLAANLVSLGAKVSVASVIGEDHNSEILRRELKKRDIDIRDLYSSVERATILFERAYDTQDPTKPVGRWDTENSNPIGKFTEGEIREFLETKDYLFDAVIAIDHCEVEEETAIITDGVLQTLAGLKVPTYGTSRNRIGKFVNFYCIVPNGEELVRSVGIKPKNFQIDFSQRLIEESAERLHRRLNPNQIVITRGYRGASLFKEGELKDIPTQNLTGPIDICGCGDTFLATLVLAETSGATTEQAIQLANVAAGTTAKKLGTTGTPTIEEIL